MVDPVVKTIEVPCSQAKAFAVFVNEINTWWPLSTYSVAAKAGGVAKSLRMEPEVGGKIVETNQDDTKYVWGTIKSYSPPDSFSMDWHPGKPAESASLVEVRFTTIGNERTRVELTESNWEAAATGDRPGRFGARHRPGWVLIFERAFRSACGGDLGSP